MSDYAAAFAAIEQVTRQRMAASQTPGVALAITDRERTLYVTTLGVGDLAAQRAVTPEMLFEIGSIGKSFTALVMMQLVAAGKIDLHMPVAHYLPWFAVQSPFAPITVHHLLSHMAGITSGADFTPSAEYEPYALRFLQAAYAPGERYHYSNVGYKTLGYLLEAVAGQPYRTLLQQRILDPVGMTTTDAVTTHASRLRMATGYVPLFDDQPFYANLPQIPAPWLEYSCADGSPAAPVTNMAVYLRMLLNHGAGIVAPEQFAQMIQPIAAMGDDRFYGYGLISEALDGRRIIGHGGGTVGFGACLLGDLDEGIGVMLLTNGRCPLYTIARFALGQLYAARHDLPLPAVPTSANPYTIPHATEYAGVYGGHLTLLAESERLMLVHGEENIALEPRGPDAFYVPHPAYRHFLLRFAREDERIVAATHGASWYPAEGITVTDTPEPPSAWLAYPGVYRSHNPWFSNFAVVLRQGQLMLLAPEGSEEALHPSEGDWFWVGDTLEQIGFDALVAGQALRAHYSGGDYYRQNDSSSRTAAL